MNFATLDAALPDELADRIARLAHKSQFDQVTTDIVHGAGNLLSDFDQAIKAGAANIKDYMTEKYGDRVKVIIDDYIDWYTIVFLFPTTSRFALFHHYAEWNTCDQFVIDGTYTSDTIHIDRYVYVDRRGEYHTECDHIFNFIPFGHIIPGVDAASIDLSAVGRKLWKNPKDILMAFGKVEYGEE
jgi:hypothetical protein